MNARYYEIRHRVLLDETNAVGNVYYAHHVRWQGWCRERFLVDHAPSTLVALRQDLRLVTVSCSCDYLVELLPFDEVAIRMTLADVVQNRIDMRFEYWRVGGGSDVRVAVGSQRVACMSCTSNGLQPCEVPAELRRALAAFETIPSNGRHATS